MTVLRTERQLEAREAIRDLSERTGVRSVAILAWRDVADAEAGGSEIHAAQVAREWAAAGISVTMRTSAADGQPPADERDGYRVVRRSGRHMVFLTSIRDHLLGKLRQADGLLEVWNGVPYLSPAWWRRPRITFIHHVHRNMWDMSLSPRLAAFGRVLERRLAPPFYRRTRVLTPSEASKQEIVDYLGLPAENVRVVGPGVDPRFVPGGRKTPWPSLLAVGRLVPYKQFETLIAIMPAVRERVPDARLVIVGDGYHRPALERTIEECGAGEYVELRGHVTDEELVEAYQAAWVLTSASIAEGWGMTITEAAACGTPAVVSAVGGHHDAVADGVSGLLAYSQSELINELTLVLADRDVRMRLTQGAVDLSADRTWASTAYGIFAELAAVASNGR